MVRVRVRAWRGRGVGTWRNGDQLHLEDLGLRALNARVVMEDIPLEA